MCRYAASIQYNGNQFYGWQKLKNDLITVQDMVEQAITTVANHNVDIVCAGRTDAKVHALGQIIHFDSNAQRSIDNWQQGINSNLPDTIATNWVKPVNKNFHARFSALWRHYRYLIYNHNVRPTHFAKGVTLVYKQLDHNLMQLGANYLVGEHDFNSFRAVQCQSKTSVRKILQLQVKRVGNIITIDIQANAFLHHMVRNIVGALIAVGHKKRNPEWIHQVLLAKDRTKSGVTAPSYGLYFMNVGYPENYSIPKYDHNNNLLDLFMMHK
jgi:tRNA pseudouridine38-40 synthase